MKIVFFFLLFLPVLAAAQSTAGNSSASQDSGPQFQFKEDSWDFGNISEGVPAIHTFEFTNAGKEPIVISQVTASCGCTTPVWPKEPVAPGAKGVVSVSYNAARQGSFVKSVTVLSNTGEPKYLTVKGNVIPRTQK
jgi:hypothetical protein